MSECHEGKVEEEVLSGLIAGCLQNLVKELDKEKNSLFVLHQTYAPIKPYSRVDIGIVNFSEPEIYQIHSICEVKWFPEADFFPEAQACASARKFYEAKCLKHQWIPILVLTKSSYQLGIGFEGFGPRWAFSEIFECLNDFPFRATSNNDILQLLHFVDFFVMSANFHRAYQLEKIDSCSFVNQAGHIVLESPEVLADRVLLSRDNGTTFKFYENRKAAVDAIVRQNIALQFLGTVHEAHPKLVEGCGAGTLNGICAVLDDYVNALPDEKVTYDHLITLTEMVARLHENKWVHGDLRLPNIIFLTAGRVRLIDFDWSGKAGAVSFPSKANADAFGLMAARLVRPERHIPANFDWICLADLLLVSGCKNAAHLAKFCFKDKTIAEFKLEKIQEKA